MSLSISELGDSFTAVQEMLPKVIGILLVVIIIICAWKGFKKGIIMGVVGVLVFILSLFGAQLLSDTFSYEVIPVLKPFVSGYAESRVEETAFMVFGFEPDVNGEYHVSRSLSDLVEEQPDARFDISDLVYRGLGFYSTIADDMAQKTVTYAEQNNADLPSSVTAILCQSVTWYGGFLIAFILLFAALTVAVNLLNLSFRIPYIGIINDLGGLCIGVFTGFLFCALVVWVLQFTGILIPEQLLSESGLAGWFLDKNLLVNYITF